MKRPKPNTTRSPNLSTSFPEKSPETNRIMANEEMIRPMRVLETPKVLAKIGIAGIITLLASIKWAMKNDEEFFKDDKKKAKREPGYRRKK